MSINKLFKSRGVICEMLEVRGYNLDLYKNFSINEVELMFKGSEKKTTAELGSLDMSITISSSIKKEIFEKL